MSKEFFNPDTELFIDHRVASSSTRLKRVSPVNRAWLNGLSANQAAF